MQIVIELTADQVEALEAYLSTQFDDVPNEITGNLLRKPKYTGVEHFILSQTSIYVGNAMQMYPPASVQADMQTIKAAQDRIAQLSKPTLATGSRP